MLDFNINRKTNSSKAISAETFSEITRCNSSSLPCASELSDNFS